MAEEAKIEEYQKLQRQWMDQVEQLVFEARVADNAKQYKHLLEIVIRFMKLKNSLANENSHIVSPEEKFPIDYSVDERDMVGSCFKSYIANGQEALKRIRIVRKRSQYVNDQEFFEGYERKI